MRFLKYLKEENIIQKALNIEEPEIGKKYPKEKIDRYLEIINKALDDMKNKKNNDSNDAIVADLRDKKEKWNNVEKETKPIKLKHEIPKDQEEEPEEEEPEEEEPEEEEPPPENKKKK